MSGFVAEEDGVGHCFLIEIWRGCGSRDSLVTYFPNTQDATGKGILLTYVYLML